MSDVQKRAGSKHATPAKADAPLAQMVLDQEPLREILRDGRPDQDDQRFLTVTELARELSITARTLRFYEDKKLISPRRVAHTRVYTNRERARMILILRGKRLGFSLREIKDYLDLYDADAAHVTQAKALLQKIETRRRQLEEQKVAVEQALTGLKELEADALAGLAAAAHRSPAAKPGLSKIASKPITRHIFAEAASSADHQESNL